MKRIQPLAQIMILLFITGIVHGQERVTIKCATIAPKGSPWMNHLEAMNKEVYRRTRGRVRFKFFPGGIAGEEKAVLEKIRYGQLQGGALTGLGLSSIVPAVRILEIPFTFRNLQEYDHVRDKMTPDLEKRFKKKGFVVLGWTEGGMAHIFSRHRIVSDESLKPAKFWLRPGDPVVERVLTDMKLTTVPLALPEVLTAIQTGLVDTVYASPVAVIAVQWFPHVKHMINVPLVNILAGLVVDRKVFEKISEDDQETLRKVCRRHIDSLTRQTRSDDQESRVVLQEKGITLVTPQSALVTRFRRVCNKVADSLIGESYEQELVDNLRRHLRGFRKRESSGQ